MKTSGRLGLCLALTGAIAGCDLEFVDVDLGTPAHFSAVVLVQSDSDTIRIDGLLAPGLDGSGQRRAVTSGLQIDGRTFEPEARTEQDWRWNARVPASSGAKGHLVLTPPRIEGVASSPPIIVPVPLRGGSREISVPAGQPIRLNFSFAPLPADGRWDVRLTDADQRELYVATSAQFPAGPISIHDDVVPSGRPGPFKAVLFVSSYLPGPHEDEYRVSVVQRGVVTWVIGRE